MKKLLTLAAILTAVSAVALPCHFLLYVPEDNYTDGNPSVSNKIEVFFQRFADPNALLTTQTRYVNTNTATTNLCWTFWTEHLQGYNESITAADGQAIQTQLGASGVRSQFTDDLQHTFATNSMVPVEVSGGVTNEP